MSLEEALKANTEALNALTEELKKRSFVASEQACSPQTFTPVAPDPLPFTPVVSPTTAPKKEPAPKKSAPKKELEITTVEEAPATPAAAVENAPTVETPTYSAVSSAVVDLVTNVSRDAAIKLMAQYKVDHATKLVEAQYAAFIADARKLIADNAKGVA